jgi:uncharacterized damage-inducible protein DinB
MKTVYSDYFSNLQELHAEIRKAIAALPPEALDWTPGFDTNSVSVLVVHVTGAQRYWVSDVLAGEPSGRDRDAEFKAQGWSAAALNQRLSDSEVYMRGVFELLSLPDLEAKRISPRNGREVTVGWVLGHVLKHTALHLGHIEILRQLWEQGDRG